MIMQEDRTSKSSGYVEIPIHVLYKTEYIDSVVQQRRKNGNSLNMLKIAKLRIKNAFVKLKDRISTALRGYYQEIIINNVDGKTRQNMVGYIKSLNLETKEFLDPDGTRVIVVDIGPIKKKPEMNDLLVYIENEKLKIARRTEAKNKCLTDKEDIEKNHDKLNIPNHGESTSGNSKIISENSMVHPRGGGDSVLKPRLNNEKMKSKVKTKHKRSIEDGIYMKKISDYTDKENKRNEIVANTVATSKFKSKELFVEDPLTKAERKVKLRMKSQTKATRMPESTDNNEMSLSKTIYTCESSSTGDQDKKETMESFLNESSSQLEWPVNSFINSQMNGIGVFWNAESVVYNDTKINLIERSNVIKEKETSVNVIAQYYSKDNKAKELVPNEENTKTILVKEKATEIDKNVCNSGSNTTKEPSDYRQSIGKASTSKRSKASGKTPKASRQPLIRIKDVEPYMSNGVTSDPSFHFRTTLITQTPAIKGTPCPKKDVDVLQNNQDTPKIKKKKKRKFFKFCKKLFPKKKSLKGIDKDEIICKSNDVVPIEVHVKCITTPKKVHDGDITKTKPDNKQKKTENISTKNISEDNYGGDDLWLTNLKNSIKKIDNDKLLEAKSSFNSLEKFKYFDNESNCSVNVFYTDNRHYLFDRGDNKKMLAMSDLEVSEIEIPHSSNTLSFNWKDHHFNSIKEKKERHKSVVNKLYNKLKSLRSRRVISDTEMTSASFGWEGNTKYSNDDNFCYDDVTLSSLDSIRVSVDTVQSVTQTVIKRLAKSYPKEKRT